MHKGLLRVTIDDLSLCNAAQGTVVLYITAGQCQYYHKVSSLSHKMQPVSIYLPIEYTIYVQIGTTGTSENEGYFNLPISKLYYFPDQKHLVSINCITRNKATRAIINQPFAKIEVIILYRRDFSATLLLTVDTMALEQYDTEYCQLSIRCKVGDVIAYTTAKQAVEKACYFNYTLTFTLLDIPADLHYSLVNTNTKESLGDVQISPLQSHLISEYPVSREYGLSKYGKQIARVIMKTIFRMNT